MAKYNHGFTAYVATDGSYSASEDVLTFDADALTEKQWDLLGELSDADKFYYALAVLDEDEQVLKDYETNSF